jgi:hypothetical protein
MGKEKKKKTVPLIWSITQLEGVGTAEFSFLFFSSQSIFSNTFLGYCDHRVVPDLMADRNLVRKSGVIHSHGPT